MTNDGLAETIKAANNHRVEAVDYLSQAKVRLDSHAEPRASMAYSLYGIGNALVAIATELKLRRVVG